MAELAKGNPDETMTTSPRVKRPYKLFLKLEIKKDPHTRYLKILNKTTMRGRSVLKIKEHGDLVIIEIMAKDATSLRASTNSILRDLQVIGATEPKQK